MDPLADFKAAQRKGWAHFVPLETFTATAAPHLVKLARIAAGARVLDVGCGSGVVALTAARAGARVTGLDLTPELLSRARENAALAGVTIEWQEGDAEALPFADASFDVVLSQFGHMFAPRPEVATAEMLRVLKPGGTIAFSTWPPDGFVGRIFGIIGGYLPPPPPGIAPPNLWGEPTVVRERLGSAVKDLVFDRARMITPALSPQHLRSLMERTAGPVIKLLEVLASDPPKLALFRRDFDQLISQYFDDNQLRQDFLMSRAIKA